MTTISSTWLSGAMIIDGAEHWPGDIAPVIDPSTGEPFAEVSVGTEADAALAVDVATKAFKDGRWSRRSPGERAEVLLRLADLLEGLAVEVAELESRNTGKPLKFSKAFDLPLTVDNLRFFAAAARSLEGRATGEYADGYTSTIRREPLGVTAAITPWNYPLNMAGWKIGPALAAGNSIVIKPAEITPLTTILLARLALEAGVPPGVVNVVTGSGARVGNALAADPRVALLSVTGSTATGEAVMRAAAPTVKRLHLELGGKAPFVVFDDAHLEAAVEGAIVGGFANSGQDCTAATRIYVQQPRYDEFVEQLVARTSTLRIGAPLDEQTDLGPLVSAKHHAHVVGIVERAKQDGAEVLVGGEASGPGFFYAPTVIAGASQASEIVQEEVFGPVLVVLPFDDDDAGFAAANDNRYGLAASAWTRDTFRAQRAARELDAGTVWINEHLAIFSDMPHGGVKASGFGKDMSLYAVEEHTVVKHVVHELTDAPRKPWYDAVSRPREDA